MENQNIQFREEEIVIMSHWDKNLGSYTSTVYPKIGGRLRLAHEENQQLSITTETIQYDGNLAVVKATCSTDKGSYCGIGMASIERDERIAPAILELAETRAIARSLRFAGYGVEYCSAEEISHLENGNGTKPEGQDNAPTQKPANTTPIPPRTSKPFSRNSGSAAAEPPSRPIQGKNENPANGDGRISNKQLTYIIDIGRDIGLDSKSLEKECLALFGVRLAYLTRKDASAFIDTLKRKAA